MMSDSERRFVVLMPVALPSSGPELLRLAAALVPPGARPSFHALHLTQGDNGQADPLEPLMLAASKKEIPVHSVSFQSEDVAADIASVADELEADLVIMGWFEALTDEDPETGLAHSVMRLTKADVGVYLCRQFKPWSRVLVPFHGGPHDLSALKLAGHLAARAETDLTILHVIPPHREEGEKAGIIASGDDYGYGREHVKIVQTEEPIDAVVDEAKKGYDLVIIGASDTWGLEYRLFDSQHERLAFECPASLLVVRKLPVNNGNERAKVKSPGAAA